MFSPELRIKKNLLSTQNIKPKHFFMHIFHKTFYQDTRRFLSVKLSTHSLFSILLMLFSVIIPINKTFALGGSQVAVTRSTAPFFMLDSNKPNVDGPHAAHVGIQILNTSGGQLNQVYVKLTALTKSGTASASLGYIGTSDSIQWVGKLGSSDTGTAYFYIKYPGNTAFNDTIKLTVAVGDSASGTVTFQTHIILRSSISANAGGLLVARTLSTFRHVGTLVTDTVTYSYGNVQTGDELTLYPCGDTAFNAGGFQLINAQVLSSAVTSVNVGQRNTLYFVATATTRGSGNIIKMVYYYINKMVAGDSTIIAPYAGLTSGNTNFKYSSNFGTTGFVSYFLSTTGSLSVTKSVSSVHNYPGDTVTYTVAVTNNNGAAVTFDYFLDTMPTGYTFVSLESTSDITSAISSQLPSAGNSGVIIFRGGLPATFPYVSYTVNGSSTVNLKYKVKLKSTASLAADRNVAHIFLGNTSFAKDTSLTYVHVRVSGTLYRDTNGLTDALVNGTARDSSGSSLVYAYLVNGSNQVMQRRTLNNGNGLFTFDSVPAQTNYTVRLSTTATTINQTAPSAANLPSPYVAVGENFGNSNSAGSGNESGTSDASIAANVGTAHLTTIQFGIQQTPTPTGTTLSSQLNPGGTNAITIATSNFTGSDPDGRLIQYKFTGFPTNTTTFSINGTSYTSGTFPGAGVTVSSISSVTLDPVDGALTAVIPFNVIDNANQLGSSTANVNVPFFMLNVSGTVFHDVNGLVDETVNGTAIDQPSSTTLYVYLVNGSGNVVAKDTLNNGNGTYTFNNAADANTPYTVRVSTSNVNEGATAPSTASLPSGWVAVSEAFGSNNSAGSGNESGTANSQINVTTTTSNVTGVIFGIEQVSVAHNKTYTNQDPNAIYTNSGNSTYPKKLSLSNASGTSNGTANSSSSSVHPGKVSAADPEDGNYGGASGTNGRRTFVLTSLPNPTNDVMVYFNGTAFVQLKPNPTSNDSSWTYWDSNNSRYKIPNFNASELYVFTTNNGHTSFSFKYAYLDSALQLGSEGTYSITGFGPLPLKLISFENKTEGNQTTVKWTSTNEIDLDRYVLEKSTDMIEWTSINEQQAMNNGSVTNLYNYNDILTTGNNYYRLGSVNLDGTVELSKMLNAFGGQSVGISIYPVPATISLNITIGETATIRVFDVAGKMMLDAGMVLGGNTSALNIEQLSAGIYSIELTTATARTMHPIVIANR